MRPVINRLDYTTRDYEGFRQLMLDKLTELLPEYTDHRQSDVGIVILELNAMCLDIVSYYLDSVANECFLITAEQRSNIMKFCKMLGYTPRFATSAVYKQIFIKADPSTSITIRQHTKVKTKSDNPDKVIYFTTLNELTIPEGAVGDETDPNTGEYLYAVDVIHGLFVNNELLNDNRTGNKNEKYALKYAPALIDKNYFKVYVEDMAQGSGSQMWTKVNTFAGSDSSSKVYMVENNDYNETSVLFGDNSFGIAPNNARITCSYIVGGGEQGNVGLGAISQLEDNIAGIKSTSNVKVVTQGFEAESLDEIKNNAPISHRNIWGALTKDDFAGVVKVNFPEIFDSEAKKASDNWSDLSVDDIEIYLLTTQEINYAKSNDLRTVPDSWYIDNSDYSRLLGQIDSFFDSNTSYVEIGSNEVLDGARKLAGTRNVVLKHPNYVGLSLNYTLIVRDYFDINSVAALIDSYLYNYFDVGNIDFKEEISLQSLMYDIVDKSGIEGIRYLNITLNNVDLVNGEYSGTYFSVVNNDLLIPNIGSIFTLTEITKDFPNNSLQNRR